MPGRRVSPSRQPWNKGLLVGQPPVAIDESWSIIATIADIARPRRRKVCATHNRKTATLKDAR
jgi:hypothetical protein